MPQKSASCAHTTRAIKARNDLRLTLCLKSAITTRGIESGVQMREFLITKGSVIGAFYDGLELPVAWILIAWVAGTVLGTFATVSSYRAVRAKRAETHLRALLAQGAVHAIRYDSKTGTTFAETRSGSSEIPRKPYKSASPAQHFEGFTPAEVRRGARRLTTDALVHVDTWRERKRGRWSWTIKPEPRSPVVQKASAVEDGSQKDPAFFAARPRGEQPRNEAGLH